MTGNSINNQIGLSTENQSLSQIRSASGQWVGYNDQTDTFGLYNRAGTPEGNIAANIGSYCLDTTNGKMYIKTTDTVNTGWQLVASGTVPGTIAQLVEQTKSTAQATTAVIPFDNSIPQIGEGTEYMTQSFTPVNASNILLIDFRSYVTGASGDNYTLALFDGNTDALAAMNIYGAGVIGSFACNCFIDHQMVAGTTSPITFSIRFGGNAGTSVTLNGAGGATERYSTAGKAILRITEITPP